MPSVALLACDWGTTNLRAWALTASGEVIDSRDFDCGVSQIEPGAAKAVFDEQVRPALGAPAAPAILCGMVGSSLGWKPVPYVECPAGLEDLASVLYPVAEDPPVLIVPGLRGPGMTGAPDVMRGEETQILGWLDQSPERLRGEHLICHPGTHAKWALVRDGRVERFVTAMTGELFSLLTKHSVLRTEAVADDEDAFHEGVAAAGDGGGLASRLFTARTRLVAGDAQERSTSSYVSGLLIGAEVASVPRLLRAAVTTPVVLIGEPRLCEHYARALAANGLASESHDGRKAVLSGFMALYRRGAFE